MGYTGQLCYTLLFFNEWLTMYKVTHSIVLEILPMSNINFALGNIYEWLTSH